MFENNELSPDALPSVESVSWLGMDPQFVSRERAKAIIVISAGFREIGAEGLEKEKQLVEMK